MKIQKVKKIEIVLCLDVKVKIVLRWFHIDCTDFRIQESQINDDWFCVHCKV